ncbi:uncharacterized protein DDB_G0284459-like [Dreissena polymorpha]|uniref:uncharacterized protein DDB_G0284459-like n=1 Tax=Dreissena polymorpha TaxID=45954 RepID=UPI0022642E63|nr:uncharacterized protein DDB_G0284459-like [Dreissena polymorpha]XP_052258078.1 uncharacterized protein DDB_G0284459-like [Dreissena polymorpha]
MDASEASMTAIQWIEWAVEKGIRANTQGVYIWSEPEDDGVETPAIMEETPAMQAAISPAPTSVRLRLSGSSRPSSRAFDLSRSSDLSRPSRSSRSSRAPRSSSSSMSSRASTSSSSLSRSSSSDSEYVPFEAVTSASSDEDVPLVAPPVPVVARVVPLVALPSPRPERRMRNMITEADELAINMVFAEDIVSTSLSGKSIGIEVVRRNYNRATMGRLGFEQVRAKIRNLAKARAARLAAGPM